MTDNAQNQPEAIDKDWEAIQAMMAEDDFAGLGQKIQTLMKLPQSLCKTRGDCCRIATFKGNMSYERLCELAASDNPDSANAREFLTLFEPYANLEDVRSLSPVFVERVLQASANSETQPSFFKCRFLSETGRCEIHEDRPTGCRMYPFPHEKTLYHPGCGFEKQGLESWRKVEAIQRFFQQRLSELETQKAAHEQQ